MVQARFARRRTSFVTALIVAAGLAAVPLRAAAGPALLLNGNFDAGNVGFFSAYSFSPGNLFPESTYDVVANPHDSHDGAIAYTALESLLRCHRPSERAGRRHPSCVG